MKTLEFCSENGIEMLCVYLPYPASAEQQRIANSIGDIVNNYSGCSYVNMLNLGLVDYEIDVYSDNSHLNYSGALKTTRWIGKYLIDHYSLLDYSDSTSWNMDWKNYTEFLTDQLKSFQTLEEKLLLLQNSLFKSELIIFDQKILENTNLQKLLDNNEIEVSFDSANAKNSGAVAKLIVYSNLNQLLIEEVSFDTNLIQLENSDS